MRILVVGSGGREHALVWRLSTCENVTEIFACPGNPGIGQHSKLIDIKVENIEAIKDFALNNNIDLVVIGPEIPLALGLADLLRKNNINAFGPSKLAAQLESSKSFSKEFMKRHNIPTAKFETFTAAEPAKKFLATLNAPYVIKASGLAAGKGVVIAQSLEIAEREIDEMFEGKFGDASNEIVIEEFMEGEEASFFVLCNTKSAIILPICQDHKRAFDNDEGPNTGGMGAYAPTSLIDDSMITNIMEKIANPTINGMISENMPYNGVLYIGLMMTKDGPKVVEYNCRFGDPECQILMQFVGNDFANCLLNLAREEAATLDIKTTNNFAVTIVMASNGYPNAYVKDGEISGIGAAESNGKVKVFHAGTALKEDVGLVASGGRVLNVTTMAEDIKTALNQAYVAIEKINAPTLFYRKDIGHRELNREK